ncbi:hypothetical protein SNEBB_007988 [Seison nebaliae]|nr:hypothetical protein SNEBB_007988 [Seison nebaliae]
MILFFISLIQLTSAFNLSTNHDDYKNLRGLIENYKFYSAPSNFLNSSKTRDNKISYTIKHYLIEKQNVLSRRYHVNVLFRIRIKWEDGKIEQFQNQNLPNLIDLTSFTPYLWLPLKRFDLKRHDDGEIVRWNHELTLNIEDNSFTITFHKLHQMTCHLMDSSANQMKCESSISLFEPKIKMTSHLEGDIIKSSLFEMENFKEENFIISFHLRFMHQISNINIYLCYSILTLLYLSFGLSIVSRERIYLLSIILILVTLLLVSFFVSGDIFSKHYYNRIIFLTVYSTFLCIYITVFWMRLAIGDPNVFLKFPQIMKLFILNYLSFVVGLSGKTREISEEILKMENERIDEKSNDHSHENVNVRRNDCKNCIVSNGKYVEML